MRKPALLLAAIAAAMATPAQAEIAGWMVVVTSRTVVTREEAPPAGIAQYGPFRVLDARRASMVGVTDSASPGQFAAMLRDFPQLAELEMRDCPGTEDDVANLRVGRMIRAAGLATHVPANGSVRSGAVELFFAGVTRRIEQGAQFAVHAWQDDAGLQASAYAADAPENRKYVAYYREMGMSAERAAAFYAFTNSVPFEQPRWLGAAEMRQWAQAVSAAGPQLARLDLAPALP